MSIANTEDRTYQGAFFDSLVRNNRQIREDRAATIFEDAQLIYRREMEDLALEIKKLKRERDNMLDLSPAHADSLVLASDFNAKEYVKRDLELSVNLRNLEIKFDLAQQRYNYLFEQTGEE